MAWPIVIALAGPPRGKGRHRARINTSSRTGVPFVQTYPDNATVRYESQLRYAAQQQMQGQPPTSQPLSVTVEVVLAIPESWSKKKRAAAAAQLGVYPMKHTH